VSVPSIISLPLDVGTYFEVLMISYYGIQIFVSHPQTFKTNTRMNSTLVFRELFIWLSLSL
jgi:hypothetical protein